MRAPFDPDLQPALADLGLLFHDGARGTALHLDAINRYQFFDPVRRAMPAEAYVFLAEVAEDVWHSISADTQAHPHDLLKSGSRAIEGWFAKRWYLGAWFTEEERRRNGTLLDNRLALSWLVPEEIKRGLEGGRFQI